MTITIPLTRGYTAIVDDEDADLADLKWSVLYVTDTNIYAQHRFGEETKVLHRLIMERIAGYTIKTHERVNAVDGNKLNCRRNNLRLATYSQSHHSSKRMVNNRSGYKGVHWSKSHSKWRARITVSGKTKHLGFFRSSEEAAQAYKKASLELFGEYARFDQLRDSED